MAQVSGARRPEEGGGRAGERGADSVPDDDDDQDGRGPGDGRSETHSGVLPAPRAHSRRSFVREPQLQRNLLSISFVNTL